MKPSYVYYKMMRGAARVSHPCKEVTFASDPGDEPAVFVGNHSVISGPSMTTLYLKRPHKTWAISYATDGVHTKSYAFHDVLMGRTRKHPGACRFVSGVISHALPPLLEYSDTIPVYHDRQIFQTFKQSIAALENGEDIVIFAESAKRFSPYVNELQSGFVDLAKLYYRRTGKCLRFFPMYVCKALQSITFGEPINYDPDMPLDKQREVIAAYLRDGIDALARSLPPHTPIPFLSDRWYEQYGEYEDDFAAYWQMIAKESEQDIL